MSRTHRTITGRPVMITGAASGIGRSLARRLSRSGSPGGHRGHRRGRLKETAGSPSPATGAHPGARRTRRRRPVPFRGGGAGVADGSAGRGVQQRRRRGRVIGPRRRPRRRRVAAADQLRRRGQRHSRLPADPGGPGRRRDREHLERVRPARHALPECLLRVEVRGARLHRRAAAGAPRHRRLRRQRSPRRHQDQHRPQRAGTQGPGRPRPQPPADGRRLRGHLDDLAGQGGEIISAGSSSGKARILVGPDAYVFDTLARVAPTHYYDVIAQFERRLRSRQPARRYDPSTSKVCGARCARRHGGAARPRSREAGRRRGRRRCLFRSPGRPSSGCRAGR